MYTYFERLERWLSTNKTPIHLGVVFLFLFCLYLTSRVNYLLFHSLAELFSIIIASGLFLVAWNSRQYLKNSYLLCIGIAYVFIACLDLLHTLAYKGMPIFLDYDYYANQLWIAARYLESISLAGAFYFLMRKKTILPYLTFVTYAAVCVTLVMSIFWWKVFPECFIEGHGLTPFKKFSEYIICLILVVGGVLLYKNRDQFEQEIFYLLLASLGCTIVSELAFTFYISNYGLSNLIGHYFKIFSFFFVYKAIIQTGIQTPYAMIFRDLENSNRNLTREIKIRKKTESELQSALDDVKVLSGIIPICSYCKQIRDDTGYWQRVEEFIHKNSDAQFSHGICPSCYDKEMEAISNK